VQLNLNIAKGIIMERLSGIVVRTIAAFVIGLAVIVGSWWMMSETGVIPSPVEWLNEPLHSQACRSCGADDFETFKNSVGKLRCKKCGRIGWY